MFGIIDWAAERREALPDAVVDLKSVEKKGQMTLRHCEEDFVPALGLEIAFKRSYKVLKASETE